MEVTTLEKENAVMPDAAQLGFGVAGALDPRVVRIVAERLEDEGFRTLWINDTPDGDSLSGLAAAAGVTTSLRLATGVISIDRREPAEIIGTVQDYDLPQTRLVVGIGGSAKPRPLQRVEEALQTLGEELTCRLMVGALGPKMRELGARQSDGLLLNWLTPDAARDAVAEKERDANRAGKKGVEACLYVRTALGEAAHVRMVREAERYEHIPSYAANFRRMGVNVLETTVSGDSPELIWHGLDRYRGILDEIVVRAITPSDDPAEYLRLIDALVGHTRR